MNKHIAVVLRADHKIGTGHLMRVNALLPALADAGYKFLLFCDSFDDRLQYACKGYEDLIKNPDLNALPALINAAKPALTLFDHYFLSADIEKNVRGLKAVIDDLKRSHVCDLLTDSVFFRRNEDYADLVPSGCKLLTGEKYSLIRREFIGLKHTENLRSRVLINYGGSDPAHACLTAVRSVLAASLQHEFDFTLLTGAANEDHEVLCSLLRGIDEFEIIRSTPHMGALFRRCDLAMGAYGGSFKERMCVALPSLCTVIADNQQDGPRIMKRLKAGLDMSLSELSNPLTLKARLHDLYAQKDFFIAKGLAAVDGRGLARVGNALLELLHT